MNLINLLKECLTMLKKTFLYTGILHFYKEIFNVILIFLSNIHFFFLLYNIYFKKLLINSDAKFICPKQKYNTRAPSPLEKSPLKLIKKHVLSIA